MQTLGPDSPALVLALRVSSPRPGTEALLGIAARRRLSFRPCRVSPRAVQRGLSERQQTRVSRKRVAGGFGGRVWHSRERDRRGDRGSRRGQSPFVPPRTAKAQNAPLGLGLRVQTAPGISTACPPSLELANPWRSLRNLLRRRQELAEGGCSEPQPWLPETKTHPGRAIEASGGMGGAEGERSGAKAKARPGRRRRG